MTNDEHQQQIDDCINREERISEWERDFVQSLDEQMARGNSLSEKQVNVLDRIWNKATGRG